MLRIPAKELANAAEALLIAAAKATTCDGKHVLWTVDDMRKAEKAVLIGLSALAAATGVNGPITPDDEYYLIMREGEPTLSWPPEKFRAEQRAREKQ